MKAYTRRVVFFCILLGSYTLTDAYGLSQKTSGNKKLEKQTEREKQAKQTKAPTVADRKVKPGDKLATEILELQRMYHQLNQEKVGKAGLERKQQLLNHIENQIKLRQRKQAEQQLSTQEQQQQQPQQPQQQPQQQQQPHQQQRHQQQQAAYASPVAQARQVHQFFDPVQSLPLHSDQHSNTLRDINQHVLTQQHVDQYQGSQTQGHNVVLTSNGLPIPSVQTEAQVPQSQFQVVQRQPIQFIDTQPAQRPVVQHVGPQQHILVPLTALSSGQFLNGQGMMSDQIILVNSLVKNQAGAEALPQNKPSSTTTTTTTATTTMATTEQPTTTVTPPPTDPPTTPSTEETTVMDLEHMKQTLLERSLKKQSLEIKKLQLEIRALQRQERNSLPEENEDGPQPRRFLPRQLPMPFIR